MDWFQWLEYCNRDIQFVYRKKSEKYSLIQDKIRRGMDRSNTSIDISNGRENLSIIVFKSNNPSKKLLSCSGLMALVSAKHGSSRKFLKCPVQNFLCQKMVGSPRESAILDLILIYKEKLVEKEYIEWKWPPNARPFNWR